MDLSDYLRRKLQLVPRWVMVATLITGVFFLSQFALRNVLAPRFSPDVLATGDTQEVFGFAPYWSLSKMDNIDWHALTTFAYFSLTVNGDGTIDRNTGEWDSFESKKLDNLFDEAKKNHVRRVITLTQMEPGQIRALLGNEDSWKVIADESVDILKSRDLDGVNIDFEFMPNDENLRSQFTKFSEYYNRELKSQLNNPYITVSVLASSEKERKIYDIGPLSKIYDAIFMMAYDFYYPGSETIGPSAPLYGYNNGKGPYWYDVSTAVEDFLKVAEPNKIIMGVPYYGWNYPAYAPQPNTASIYNASATTNDRARDNKLLETTPVGGWDNQAHVSWRGYWDGDGWRVVYIEDKKSLSDKYDFAKSKKLAGVGIWALGFDSGDDTLWKLLDEKFSPKGKRS